MTVKDASLFILECTTKSPFYPEKEWRNLLFTADLGDFNVVLRGRLTQSRQIWVLCSAVRKQIAARVEVQQSEDTGGISPRVFR